MVPGLERRRKEIRIAATGSYKTISTSSYNKEGNAKCQIKQVLTQQVETQKSNRKGEFQQRAKKMHYEKRTRPVHRLNADRQCMKPSEER